MEARFERASIVCDRKPTTRTSVNSDHTHAWTTFHGNHYFRFRPIIPDLGDRLWMVHSAGRSIERMEREWPELGQAIRQRRRKLGLSQEELAGKVGTALSYMSEIETAKVSPSVAVLRRIADALGMKTSELVADAESLD